MAPPPTGPDGADSYGERQTPAERGDVNLRAGAQMLEYVAIAERMAREMSGPVLDWGCGYGQMTHLLRERGMEVSAFDWHPDAAPGGEEVHLDHYPGVVAHRSSDPVLLPFPDDSFQCALSCGVLEHVQQPGGSLDELHRVLRPGGRLLVYKLPNRFSYLEALARRLGLYYHGALPDDEVYTRRSAAALVSAHGFRVDAVRLSNLLPLTLTHPLLQSRARAVWSVNRMLGGVPGVRLLATNVELDATAV